VRQRLAPPFHLAESQIRREPERLYKATENRLSPTSSVCCSCEPPSRFLGVAWLRAPHNSQRLQSRLGGGNWPGAVAFFGSRCQNAADRSLELTAYKSYSIPADVLGAFAVSHANVWRCGLKVTPVPARFRLHPHLACRLPYRFPRGRFTRLLRVRVPAPWLPYRFPRGRLGVGLTAFRQQPWLPYRFPRGRLRATQRPGIPLISA
jgi:hypothetical protein